MKTVTYSVPNISCDHCTHTIKMEVGDLEGVLSVNAEVDTQAVEIQFDESTSEDQIQALLTEINYPPALS